MEGFKEKPTGIYRLQNVRRLDFTSVYEETYRSASGLFVCLFVLDGAAISGDRESHRTIST